MFYTPRLKVANTSTLIIINSTYFTYEPFTTKYTTTMTSLNYISTCGVSTLRPLQRLTGRNLLPCTSAYIYPLLTRGLLVFVVQQRPLNSLRSAFSIKFSLSFFFHTLSHFLSHFLSLSLSCQISLYIAII